MPRGRFEPPQPFRVPFLGDDLVHSRMLWFRLRGAILLSVIGDVNDFPDERYYHVLRGATRTRAGPAKEFQVRVRRCNAVSLHPRCNLSAYDSAESAAVEREGFRIITASVRWGRQLGR